MLRGNRSHWKLLTALLVLVVVAVPDWQAGHLLAAENQSVIAAPGAPEGKGKNQDDRPSASDRQPNNDNGRAGATDQRGGASNPGNDRKETPPTPTAFVWFTPGGGNPAPKGAHVPIGLCHATDDPARPYLFLVVDDNSAEYQGHLRHSGDVIPATEEQCGGAAAGSPPTATPTQPSGAAVVTTPTATATQVVTPTATATQMVTPPATATPEPTEHRPTNPEPTQGGSQPAGASGVSSSTPREGDGPVAGQSSVETSVVPFYWQDVLGGAYRPPLSAIQGTHAVPMISRPGASPGSASALELAGRRTPGTLPSAGDRDGPGSLGWLISGLLLSTLGLLFRRSARPWARDARPLAQADPGATPTRRSLDPARPVPRSLRNWD